MHVIAFFVIGLLCGHAWPTGIGFMVTVGALLSITAAWYTEHSPDEIFDFLDDYCEKLVRYVYLPWAVGAIGGALWLVLA